MTNCLFIPGKVTVLGKIIGNHVSRIVTIDGKDGTKLLDPGPSQKLYNHSPDGFSWGYGGSGPSQLALAILLEIIGENIALKYYQEFKREVIAAQPQDKDLVLKIDDVVSWVFERQSQMVEPKIYPIDPKISALQEAFYRKTWQELEQEALPPIKTLPTKENL